ncbi:alpha/beta hydrolase [Lactococcus nasutitermitis]|uniref:Alpha/beta hydrolase n=1 Tax=Lactococcus nasutitermitis TaxID=1652957 RepID=A0ABV9JD00_9LACT|nr:alpha/beta hydrolase [Lactococcus nasutitermitis]
MNIKHLSLNQNASVTFYQRENPRKDRQSMPAIIICPGGGYKHISVRESEPLALAFLAQVFQVFVLSYSVMDKGIVDNILPQAYQELENTFELIYSNHREWEIDCKNIFLLGCSAGGHLAAWYSNQNDTYKPKGTLLCYPVTSLELGWPKDISHLHLKNNHLATYDTCQMVSNKTPETFIWHTGDDKTVPIINSLKYCEQLSNYNIPFEAHFFESGPHGLSLANSSSAPSNEFINHDVARWFSWAVDWLDRKIKVQ